MSILTKARDKLQQIKGKFAEFERKRALENKQRPLRELQALKAERLRLEEESRIARQIMAERRKVASSRKIIMKARGQSGGGFLEKAGRFADRFDFDIDAGIPQRRISRGRKRRKPRRQRGGSDMFDFDIGI